MTLENHRFQYVGDTCSNGSSSFFGGRHSLKMGLVLPHQIKFGEVVEWSKSRGCEFQLVFWGWIYLDHPRTDASVVKKRHG